ncbi:hypothetical protein D3C81_2187950 [compost metagenome]
MASPESAEIHIRLSIVVDQHSRVYAEAAFDIVRFGLKRSGRIRGCGDTDSEDPFLVTRREEQIILIVLVGRIRGPHLG